VSREVLVAILAAILVNELTGASRWTAGKVARWAARRIYLSNPERASGRAEEWQALISKSVSSNISALCFGLGLGAAALAYATARQATAFAPVAAIGLKSVAGTGLARWSRILLLSGAVASVVGLSLPSSAFFVPGLLTMLAGVLIPSSRDTVTDAAYQADTKLAHRG
jgi:hypothetical protein